MNSRVPRFSNPLSAVTPGVLVNRFGLLAVILVGVVVMSQVSPVFLTPLNFTNVLYVASTVAVVAIGQMFVLLVGGIDLAVGAVVALSSVVAVGLAVDHGVPTWIAVFAALVVGAGFGLLNGFLTTKFKISALIVTLGTMSIARGLAFLYTGGSNIAPLPTDLRAVGNATVARIPVVIIFALVLAIVAHVVLTRTRFGRSVYAVGGNPTAAKLSGIRSDRIVIFAFMISGLLAAVGGVMTSLRLGAASASAGQGLELLVIAAVVIGGTSLFGGEGRVLGTLLGVLLLGLVNNSINLLAVPANFDAVVSGVIIVLAAGVDVYRRLRLEPALARRALDKQQATAAAAASLPDQGQKLSNPRSSNDPT